MLTLEEVYAGIAEDPFWDHLRLPGIKLVRGRGATQPKVLLVGEAPGGVENAREEPFRGPSGQVLDHLAASAGLCLKDMVPGAVAPRPHHPEAVPANAYVTNVVKYRPPHNRTPTHLEVEHAKADLRREWAALGGPRVIVCVGGVAHAALNPYYPVLPVSGAIGQLTRPRDPVTGSINYDADLWIVSQYHPAFGLRGGPQRQKSMTMDWELMGQQLQELGIL
jgi:DNA polymerase